MPDIKFACPYCKMKLDASLACPNGHQFENRNGIYYLHKNDDSWKEVYKEAVGTIECLKEDGIYKPCEVAHVDSYPYFDVRDHAADVNRVMFDMTKELIGRTSGSLLEIGAKNCWAVNQFLKVGFYPVVASDITDDVLTALGFANKLIEHNNKYFERVVCDGAYLPFEDEQFDVVFMCSTFHHLREKQKTTDEIYRVLKPEGTFVTMGDNPRHPDRSIEEALGPVKREREKFNINETQPTVEEYYEFLDKAGFSQYYIHPFDENLLKENWDFNKNNMFADILVRAVTQQTHPKTVSLFNALSHKTRSMFTLERFAAFNYWMNTPNNTIMWAKK